MEREVDGTATGRRGEWGEGDGETGRSGATETERRGDGVKGRKGDGEIERLREGRKGDWERG